MDSKWLTLLVGAALFFTTLAACDSKKKAEIDEDDEDETEIVDVDDEDEDGEGPRKHATTPKDDTDTGEHDTGGFTDGVDTGDKTGDDYGKSAVIPGDNEDVRYVQTGYIDAHGTKQAPNRHMAEMVITLKYSGDLIFNNQGGMPITFKFKADHKDGANTVYYQVATDILNGQESINKDGMIVVSPDRRYVQWLQWQRGKRLWTINYEHE